ncbi:MAG: hypothetical protein Q9211_005302, partial [Gyalolechia sp. 1 TL-2023]
MEVYEELIDSEELVDPEEPVDPEELLDPEEFIDSEELGDSIKTILSPVPSSPRPKWWDGEQSRYLKGAQSQSATDDLRPAPLKTGLKSFLEMMDEGPPEERDTAPATPSPTNAPSISLTSEQKSEHPDKEQVANKSKFASLRKLRLFSSNKKSNKPHGANGLKSLFSSSSRKNTLIHTTQDPDGSHGLLTSYPTPQASYTTPAVSSTITPDHPTIMSDPDPSSSPDKIHGQPPASMMRPVIPRMPDPNPSSSPDTIHRQPPASMTRPFISRMPDRDPSSSPDTIHGQPPASMMRPFIPPTPDRDRSSSSDTTHRQPTASMTRPVIHPTPDRDPSSSSDTTHGQPTASMTRPVIHHTVTGDHLNLTNHPPLSKDELANLPKDVEPTLPVDEPSHGPNRRPALRRRHSTTTISGQVPNPFPNHPLPVPKRSRKGVIQKYARNDPTGRTLEFLAHEELYGRESAIAKYAPPETIQAARGEEAGKKPFSLGAGLSNRESTKRQRKSRSPSGLGSSLATPVTPKSGHLTPSTPEFLENLARNPKAGGKHKQVSGGLKASPKLPRINEDQETMVQAPSQDQPRSRGQIRNREPVGALSRPPRRLFTSKLPGQAQSSGLSEPEPNRQIPVAKHTITPPMANIERYFHQCTPESVHSARLGILNVDDRVRVSGELRSITGTEVVWHNDQNSLFPKHPHHNRTFKAKNLWCIKHHASCALCKSACCVYMEAVEAFKYANDAYAKSIAKEAGEMIKACLRNPVEESTFLRCGECYQPMCPDCIGICPIEQCQLQ